jgi:hypothetical protein
MTETCAMAVIHLGMYISCQASPVQLQAKLNSVKCIGMQMTAQHWLTGHRPLSVFVLRVLSSLQGSLVAPFQGRFALLSFLCGCFSVVCRLCLQSLHHYLHGRQSFLFQVCLLLSELPMGLPKEPPLCFSQLPLAFPFVQSLLHKEVQDVHLVFTAHIPIKLDALNLHAH